MNMISKTACILGLALLIQVCTTSTQENKQGTSQNAKRGNFADFDVAYKAHEFDSKDAKTIKHFTGTTIQIPANAFIDEKGKPVTGTVKVNYREFHQASEIIASGITMMYDSAGKKQPFESAGMFDIRAEQAGKPVFLAKDKKINIDLASYKEGAFNFYYLQEAKQEKVAKTHFSSPFISQAIAQTLLPGEDQWQLLQTSGLPTENAERKAKLDEINKKLPTEPKEPVEDDGKTPIFDLAIDTKDFPELRSFEGVIWQYAGDLEDQNQNPDKNQWIFDQQWSSIRLEDAGEMQYRLVLANTEKRFESVVRPTLKGVNYQKAKALFEGKKKEYEADLKARANEIQSLRAEKTYMNRIAKFVRSFQIQNLGIYNCDRIFSDNEAIQVAMKFSIPEDPSASKSPKATVYLIHGKDILLQYEAKLNETNNVYLSTRQANKMLVLFSGSDKVATYAEKDFKMLGNTKKLKGKKLELELKSIPEKIKSTSALEELIAKL